MTCGGYIIVSHRNRNSFLKSTDKGTVIDCIAILTPLHVSTSIPHPHGCHPAKTGLCQGSLYGSKAFAAFRLLTEGKLYILQHGTHALSQTDLSLGF